jgi:hypothetical protein
VVTRDPLNVDEIEIRGERNDNKKYRKLHIPKYLTMKHKNITVYAVFQKIIQD